jgi:glycosyltransferase involved in cell wall biosynthesis
VVTTAVGCAPSIVRSGVDGIFVPPRDSAAVAAAAIALMNDPLRRRTLGEAARARVQGLTWRATAEHTIAAYRKALEETA